MAKFEYFGALRSSPLAVVDLNTRLEIVREVLLPDSGVPRPILHKTSWLVVMNDWLLLRGLLFPHRES